MADIGTRIQDIANEVTQEIMNEWAPEISKHISVLIAQRLRDEMAGDRGYISRASSASREDKYERVRKMFNGRNATQIARELGIGRATVYRILKKPG